MSAEREAVGRSRAVTLVPTSLWRVRLAAGVPRFLLCFAAGMGLLASARFAIAPPRESAPRPRRPDAPIADRAAEGYAVLFARRYLSWDAANPQPSEGALTAMGGAAMSSNAGLSLPAEGAQAVEWAEVVQDREPEPGSHVYTVAAQVQGRGVACLAVGVSRDADGRIALSGYPAFVGAPARDEARVAQSGSSVNEAALAVVVSRALRNYLAGSIEDLDADLSPGARVAVPSWPLALDAIQRLAWSRDRRSVEATIQAHDSHAARYTLDYELDVADADGRWEVSAIEMDPDQ